jgi:hypothetical protein
MRVPPPRHRIPSLLILIAASREPSSPGDHWRCTTISASDLIVAALPGFILGCVLFLCGGLLGPKVDPGWQDVMQGSAFFFGLIWVVIAVRRNTRTPRR